MSDEPSHDPDEEAIRRRRAELARRVTPGHEPEPPRPAVCLSPTAPSLPHRHEIAKRPSSLLRSVIVAFIVGLAFSAVALVVVWLA